MNTATATKTKAVQKSASEVYEITQQEIAQKLQDLNSILEKHAAAQKTDPRNWGRVGDIGYINEQLGQITSSFEAYMQKS